MQELSSESIISIEGEIVFLKKQMSLCAISIGEKLTEAKKIVPHGEWKKWLDEKIEFSDRMARRFISAYEYVSSSNRTTLSNLHSSKIFAILEVNEENRDDFLNNVDVESMSVRELKAEIQKYKEENGLLTEKQQKALEENRRIEQEKQRIQQELQLEKSKQSKVETRIEYKDRIVEKVVDKTDRTLESKVRKLEEDNKRLQESKRVYEDAMNTYKKSADEYQDFKDKMFKMSCVKGGSVDEVKALEDMNSLYIGINRFIKTELSPVQYEYCLNFINKNEHITDSFINLINTVEDWCLDMREKLNQNNNIITVEVN